MQAWETASASTHLLQNYGKNENSSVALKRMLEIGLVGDENSFVNWKE